MMSFIGTIDLDPNYTDLTIGDIIPSDLSGRYGNDDEDTKINPLVLDPSEALNVTNKNMGGYDRFLW